MAGLTLAPTGEKLGGDERIEVTESSEAYKPKIDLTEGLKEKSLKFNFARDIDIIFGKYTYYGNSNVEKDGYLLTSTSQNNTPEDFGTGLAHLSIDIHRVFDSNTIERIAAFRVATEEKRRLSSQEQEYYEFFSQIEDFLAILDERIQELGKIDFSRLENQGYYSPKEGEEEYAREVKIIFDEFKSFVQSAGAKYDFLATTINGEFRKEAAPVTAQKGGIAGAIRRLLGQ